MKIHTDSEWSERAKEVLPAGGFGNFEPGVILDRGQGSRVWDVQGREFLDLLIGSGPMLLGHGNKEVEEVVLSQITRGMTFFTNNPVGIELAEAICQAVPCAQQVRYVSSGGEADMYAIRLARAATGRSKILKFEGGYHGMSAEAQMSLAPSVPTNLPGAAPDSAGIPDSVRDEMLIAPYNDPDFVTSLMAEHGHEIAAIIVEPLQRIIPPEPGFLALLKAECRKYGALLIFDEIVTGFRFAYGGAQEAFGVTPDICTLGKVIGGGFALAAIASSTEIMAHFDRGKVGPEGWLMQLGTLSGNPVAAIAGLKTLEILSRAGSYDTLLGNGQRLMDIQSSALSRIGIDHQIVGHPALFDVIFRKGRVLNYWDSVSGNADQHTAFNNAMRTGGVLKSPAKIYPSLAMTEEDFALFEAAVGDGVTALENIAA